ncbi:MAG: carbamoyl-phosphate synthase domain-containing protein, partial [Pseudoclavibacter sp.]|nr:carbamoyl-phosphate synthase domain-containing protein [Pseudoclavibacter sp.]
MTRSTPAVLVLEDGARYEGVAFGAIGGERLGEVVFATGMTGYQETLSDPSYAGQIVVQTAPHIGNTGMNDEDMESRRLWVEGFVVRDPSRVVSNWRAEASLDERLREAGIPGVAEIDTRALTRRLRSEGSMRGGIFSGLQAAGDPAAQLERVRAQKPMSGRRLSELVSTPEPYTVPAAGE